MDLIVVWLFVALLMAWWADQWGRSKGLAFVMSAILTPLVWAIVLLIIGRADRAGPVAIAVTKRDDGNGDTRCPKCASRLAVVFEDVQRGDLACRHCWHRFAISG